MSIDTEILQLTEHEPAREHMEWSVGFHADEMRDVSLTARDVLLLARACLNVLETPEGHSILYEMTELARHAEERAHDLQGIPESDVWERRAQLLRILVEGEV